MKCAVDMFGKNRSCFSCIHTRFILPGSRERSLGISEATGLADSSGLVSGRHMSLVLVNLRALKVLARNCSESNKSQILGLLVYFLLGTLRDRALRWRLMFAESRATAACDVRGAPSEHARPGPEARPPAGSAPEPRAESREPAVRRSTQGAVILPLTGFFCVYLFTRVPVLLNCSFFHPFSFNSPFT